jgi:hypothetical protein
MSPAPPDGRVARDPLVPAAGAGNRAQPHDASVEAPARDPLAPVLETNVSALVWTGGTVALTEAMLRVTDPDDGPDELTYRLESRLTAGTLFKDGVAVDESDTFTQADLARGAITCRHNGGPRIEDGFDFRLSDEDGQAVGGRFVVTVSDAPAGGPTATLAGGAEDAAYTVSVADLVAASRPRTARGWCSRPTPASPGRRASPTRCLTARAGTGQVAVAVDGVTDVPTDIRLAGRTVAEHAANGTVVGTLAADGEGLPVFEFMDDAGGRFAIVGDRIVVADGLLLDHERIVLDGVGARDRQRGRYVRAESRPASRRCEPRERDRRRPEQRLRGRDRRQHASRRKRRRHADGRRRADELEGGIGEDSLSGDGGDTLRGEGGDDRLVGGSGADTLEGGAGDDGLYVFAGGGQAGEAIDGGEGTDALHALGDADLRDATISGIERVDFAGPGTIRLGEQFHRLP